MIASATEIRTRRHRKATVAWSDPELIQACRGGNQDAWNELVDRYGRLVYSIARRKGLLRADSDDVFQEVFTIVYRRLDTLRDASCVSAWLIRITHRECCRIGKRAKRYAEPGEKTADVGVPADDSADVQEQQQLVHQALRQLGGRSEQLLRVLFSGRGQPSYKAVAQQLGISVGSIGPTRARCFKKLRAILIDMGCDVADEGTPSSQPQKPIAA